uniref:Proteasome subunit beta type-4 n=1 Tax=Leptobrachium leishanense TaxID=445787 RepID=A0A8C5R1Q9_9ANUR
MPAGPIKHVQYTITTQEYLTHSHYPALAGRGRIHFVVRHKLCGNLHCANHKMAAGAAQEVPNISASCSYPRTVIVAGAMMMGSGMKLWPGGPTPGALYSFPGERTTAGDGPVRHTLIDEELLGDGHSYSPKAVHSWLTRVMYNRRSKMNPLWNTVVIGGLYEGESFLGYVDKLGVAYEAPTIATGFGAYLAQPLMREVVENKPSLTKDEARQLVDRCMKVLYYRDARSYNRYEIATVTESGVEIEGPISSETNWEIAHLIKGFE